ncbi:MAG: isochorismatase family cysteine hydrolase, partial [Eubacteriales bacterium]
DMQNDFVRKGAAMCVEDAVKTVPAIQKLIAHARKKGMPIIFTKFVTGKKPSILWNWSPQIAESHCCQRGFSRYYEDVDQTLDCTEIIDELKPEKQDYIFEKYWYSSFRNTSLVDILASEGADTIIVAGTVSQICVADTVHEGFSQGIRVIVASDGVSSFDDLQQKAALDNIHMKFGMVMSTEEIITKYK